MLDVGGLWLLWTERHWVHVSCYRDGRWSRGDSLVSTHPPGQTFWAAWCDASRDTAERPVLVWSDRGYGYTYRDVACIAWPIDSGWTPGEEIPGSENAVIPTVTRDLNVDVWVAWSPLGLGLGDFYLHTYTRATANNVRVEGVGRRRWLAWTLSEPAPETWWAVLKSDRGGESTPVARVQAGPGLEMSRADDSPPAGHPRYKVRRECVDARYQWLSPEATVSVGGSSSRGGHLILARLSSNPSGRTRPASAPRGAPGTGPDGHARLDARDGRRR